MPALHHATATSVAALTKIFLAEIERLLSAAADVTIDAAADMLTWENSGFSVDASVRITLIDRDVPSYFPSLEG